MCNSAHFAVDGQNYSKYISLVATVLRVLQALALSALIALLCFIIVILHALRPTIETTARDAHTTVLEIGLTAANLRKASLAWEHASKQQAANSTAALQAATASVKSLNRFIAHTDSSVNGNLIPTLVSSVKSQSDALLESQAALRSNLQQIQAATVLLQQDLLSANKTFVDADAQITDPAIKKTLANVEQLTESMADVGQDAKESADMAEARLRQLLKPTSIIKTIFMDVVGVGYQLRALLGL